MQDPWMSKKSLSSPGAGRLHVLPTRADLPCISFVTLMLRLSPNQEMHGYVFRDVRKEMRPVVRLPFIGKRYSAATRDDTRRCYTC